MTFCLDCAHPAGDHDDTADAFCMNCDCAGLHLDIGECDDDCYGLLVRLYDGPGYVYA